MWNEKLRGEEEGVETLQTINRVLLENLLPSHVASHFLAVIKVNILLAISPSQDLLSETEPGVMSTISEFQPT